MLDLGYIFPTYLLEKRKPMSVSMDLVEPGSKTTHLAANRSQQSEPIVDFGGIRATELNFF